MQAEGLSFATRLWFSWVCLVRILFDGAFAARVFGVTKPAAALPEGRAEEPAHADRAALESERDTLARELGEARDRAEKAEARVATIEAEHAEARKAAHSARAGDESRQQSEAREVGALLAIALLQREGRLVDFLEQDVASFDDAEIGAAARVVHQGCRKALRSHVRVAPVRTEQEGSKVAVSEGEVARAKLVGDLRGSPPFHGILRHKGWQAVEVTLPVPTKGHDARLLAPAEVEL